MTALNLFGVKGIRKYIDFDPLTGNLLVGHSQNGPTEGDEINLVEQVLRKWVIS